MGTRKSYDSYFGQGGTADGLPEGEYQEGSDETGCNAYFTTGKASQHWGATNTNSGS